MSDAAGREQAGHGALMDAVYRKQRHIYDATRKFFLLGRDRAIAELKPEPGQSVMEVGCGTGRNLIVAARRYPEARFFGFDISAAMLETAEAKIKAAGLSHRIALIEGDAATFSTRSVFDQQMDRVLMSYTLSMIPPWEAAIDRAIENIGAGGSVHIVDFGQLERLPKTSKRLLSAWLDKFHVTPRAELAAVMDRSAKAVGMTAEITPLYRGYAWLGRIA